MVLCVYFAHKTLKIILQSSLDSRLISWSLSFVMLFSWKYTFNSANYCFCAQKIKHITLPHLEDYLDQISLPPTSSNDMRKLLKIFTYISNRADADSGFGSCHESTDVSYRQAFNPTLNFQCVEPLGPLRADQKWRFHCCGLNQWIQIPPMPVTHLCLARENARK